MALSVAAMLSASPAVWVVLAVWVKAAVSVWVLGLLVVRSSQLASGCCRRLRKPQE